MAPSSRQSLQGVRSLVDYLVRPGARHNNDASAAQQVNIADLATALPQGLAIQWLGAAGFRFSYEGYDLLIDPYLTRPTALHVFGGAPLKPEEGLLRRYVPRADAVLVGHTHFDHALDVAALCRAHGCMAYGSHSLKELMRFHGLPQLCQVVTPHRVLALGPFEVTFVPSRHSPLLLGVAVPYAGEFTCDHLDQLRGHNFRCGQVFSIRITVAGTTFFHQGSAELIDDELPRGKVDYLLACIAGRGFAPTYLERTLRGLQPGAVVAHHHDNFFLPLAGPMGFSFNVNFDSFLHEVRAVDAGMEVRAFAPLQWWGPAPTL